MDAGCIFGLWNRSCKWPLFRNVLLQQQGLNESGAAGRLFWVIMSNPCQWSRSGGERRFNGVTWVNLEIKLKLGSFLKRRRSSPGTAGTPKNLDLSLSLFARLTSGVLLNVILKWEESWKEIDSKRFFFRKLLNLKTFLKKENSFFPSESVITISAQCCKQTHCCSSRRYKISREQTAHSKLVRFDKEIFNQAFPKLTSSYVISNSVNAP